MIPEIDEKWLREAIELSRNCPPTNKAYSVGAIITGINGELISTGYSRERNQSEHAEEAAIAKAQEAGKDLCGATLYSTLEPCSPRLSGKTCCTDLIIKASIKRVVFALNEPPLFIVCNGTQRLKEHRIEVCLIDTLAPLVKELNMAVLSPS